MVSYTGKNGYVYVGIYTVNQSLTSGYLYEQIVKTRVLVICDNNHVQLIHCNHGNLLIIVQTVTIVTTRQYTYIITHNINITI